MKQKLRKVLAAVLVICAISTITVYATGTTVNNAKDSSKSLDETATSETSDVPVVSDEAKILSEHESEEIIENSKKLSVYSLAVYIESMDETELSEQATADHAKAFYQNVFGENENGIVIAYAFSANSFNDSFCAIYHGENVEVSNSKIENLIKSAKKSTQSDNELVTLTSEQIIDYLASQEYNIIHADEIAERDERNTEIIVNIVKIFFILVILSIIGFGIYKIFEKKKEYDKKIKRIQNARAKIARDKEKAEEEIKNLKKEIKEIDNWKKTAIKVQPDIEKKVLCYYAKADAQKFSKKYEEISKKEFENKDFSYLVRVIDEFEKLSNLAKKFVTIDMDDVYRKYKTILDNYKTESEEKIRQVCKKYVGTEEERFKLRHAVEYYESLPIQIQSKFDSKLLAELRKKHESAEADYKIKHNEF